MMTKITFRISFIVTDFALVLIFYDFMRSFKMMIEIIFNVKRPITFGAFKFRSFKMVINMLLQISWVGSFPRAKRTFCNSVIMQTKVHA